MANSNAITVQYTVQPILADIVKDKTLENVMAAGNDQPNQADIQASLNVVIEQQLTPTIATINSALQNYITVS
jgi:hypothetical protein